MPPAGYSLLSRSSQDSDLQDDAAVDALPTVDQHAIEEEADAHAGVQKAQAAARVSGRYAKWMLFASLGLASYIYALDGSTTSAYLTFATSAFGAHSLISAIQVAQSIIIAVGKPVIAKVADVTSRATAYLAVLIFYVVGYIVIASAQNVGTIVGGIIIYAVGYTGLQLLTQIIIADLTTLKWRGLVSSLVTLPFLVNGFIGPTIAAAVLASAGWRWGYGMFAVLVPASLAPLITVLFWAEHRAARAGLGPAPAPPKARTSLRARARRTAAQLDAGGLALLGSGIALVLLPLTLSARGAGGRPSDALAALFGGGLLLLAAFAAWERRAPRPVVPARFVRSRSVLCAGAIGFFDFMSFYLTYTYLYAFVLVVKPWSLLAATYFMQMQTVALTLFGFLAGVSMWWFRRYKYVLVAGLCVRLLGVGLMLHSRGANASTAELVWTQVLQGMGGGAAAAAAQVGAQAAVAHADVAMVTAVVLLLTEIGGAVGSAAAGAIWANIMPARLARYLPALSAAERARLFGDITSVIAAPRGDATREGVIHAYDDTMKVMVLAATAASVVPLLAACAMPNWYLGDTQNAVDGGGGGEDDVAGLLGADGDADADADGSGRLS